MQCHPKLILTKSGIVTSLNNSVHIKVFGGEPGPAATLAPKLGPLGLVLYLLFRMLKRLVKILSKKEENGRESE